MASREVLLKRLDEAEQAYHDLTIGDMARVFVDSNSERVEYQAADSAKLAAYIRSLRFQLGLPGGIGRPMGVFI